MDFTSRLATLEDVPRLTGVMDAAGAVGSAVQYR
jgi:hypothetical protein